MARRLLEEDEDDLLTRRTVRQFFDLLDPTPSGEGECTPPVDVLELDDRVEITVDLPGVPAGAVRVVFSRGTLVVSGRKLPRVCEHSVAFHLAERSFGRFVRVVGLTRALDTGRATATLAGGELRVVVPRIVERRGHDIEIEVKAG